MPKIPYKLNLNLLIIAALSLAFMLPPHPAHAQWPPFSFSLSPAYDEGKITYTLRFAKEVAWPMADLLIVVPLPAGARFVAADAQATTTTSFDGVHVTFLTTTLHDPLSTVSFVVEVADPAQTVFTTHAWIAWKGEQPGDYLTPDVSLDTAQAAPQPLDWDAPRSRLQLEMNATLAGEIITYAIYPKNVGGEGRRMWDLKILLPIPPGTTYLKAEAPPPFTTSFDGREVAFSILEMERQKEVGPLKVQVSPNNPTYPTITTHAWATWKNVGRRVVQQVELQEDVRSGDLIIQPYATQQVVADAIGDAPFASYDLTGIALQEEASALKVTFYTVDTMGNSDDYMLYIDSDCRTDTGKVRGNRGAEYWLRYQRSRDQARIYSWDASLGDWSNSNPLAATILPDGKGVAIQVPYAWLNNIRDFCWIGRAVNQSDDFGESLPSDWVGRNPTTTRYASLAGATTRSGTGTILVVSDAPATATVAPAPTPLGGKLAVTIKNEWGGYDVRLFTLPDGQPILQIPNAHQPNFRFDGERLLVNHTAGEIYEYRLADGLETRVSDSLQDAHPFYDPWGNRVVYGNPALTLGADGQPHPYLFVQCSLLPPLQEPNPQCRELHLFGILVPAGQMGDIVGTHPVWTSSDMIVFQGCNGWAGSAACGIYLVNSTSTKRLSDGFIPKRLTEHPRDLPTDTKGNLLVFVSDRSDDWEVYLMGLNPGAEVRNLSNSPASSDGPATLSPDGNWVAFASDRDGSWAIWAAPTNGGAAQRLFTLPWAMGEQGWMEERISWGP
jgi:hypothetical protein